MYAGVLASLSIKSVKKKQINITSIEVYWQLVNTKDISLFLFTHLNM